MAAKLTGRDMQQIGLVRPSSTGPTRNMVMSNTPSTVWLGLRYSCLDNFPLTENLHRL